MSLMLSSLFNLVTFLAGHGSKSDPKLDGPGKRTSHVIRGSISSLYLSVYSHELVSHPNCWWLPIAILSPYRLASPGGPLMRRCWWPGRQMLLGQTTGQRLLRSGLLSQESTWEGAGSEGGEPWQLPGMLEKYVLTPCRGCIYLYIFMVSHG